MELNNKEMRRLESLAEEIISIINKNKSCKNCLCYRPKRKQQKCKASYCDGFDVSILENLQGYEKYEDDKFCDDFEWKEE